MLSSLPKDISPQVRNAYDAVALLANACMMAAGFRLQGLGEDHIIGTHRRFPRRQTYRLTDVV